MECALNRFSLEKLREKKKSKKDEKTKCFGMHFLLCRYAQTKLVSISGHSHIDYFVLVKHTLLCFHGNNPCLKGLQLEHSELSKQYNSDICNLASWLVKKLALNSQLSFHVSTVDRGPNKDDVFYVWQTMDLQ